MKETSKRKIEGRRIFLDDSSLEHIKRLSKELKEGHCKVTHSELVSKIINIFFDRYLKREQKRLEKEFFNQKLYLKSVLKDSSSEDNIVASFEKLAKKVRSIKSAR